MSPVKSRETNLMFSQRKNPYCDLLRCKYMNNIKQVTKYWTFKLFLVKHKLPPKHEQKNTRS